MAQKARLKDEYGNMLVYSVLEPSAGDGNLIEAVSKRMKVWDYGKGEDYSERIDAIEIDSDLQTILKSKEIRVVYDDFLDYHTYKKYDLIIMNPPFSNGDRHLLKALDMQKNGGQIVCLLNAETIRTPHTVIRQDLVKRLKKHEAEIEYIENAFISADRPTGVEVALIHVNIHTSYDDCDILKGLEKATKLVDEANECAELSINIDSFLHAIVLQYEAETAAGVKLIREYLAFVPMCASSFKNNYSPILDLKLHSDGARDLLNGYLNQVRYKYWEVLFGRPEFMRLMTSKMRDDYYSKLQELKHYEFNMRNIMQIQLELSQNNLRGIEDTILDLFDSFACEHSWYPECKNNVHYYDGWATNKCGWIGKKVIIPLDAFSRWLSNDYRPYQTEGKLVDIEKVLGYLDTGSKPNVEVIRKILDESERTRTTQKIDFRYFQVTFYKKGTTHITFKNLEIIKRFNIFAGRKRGGLPPAYGKKPYSDMTTREKQVIDAFEGASEYNKVYRDRDKYIIETENVLMLGGGEVI
jgi:hypothetical protein